jgi:hypothetical protein
VAGPLTFCRVPPPPPPPDRLAFERGDELELLLPVDFDFDRPL